MSSVFCLEKRYLDARIHLDRERLKALWPEADAEVVNQHLEAIPRICAGDPAAGPIALLSQRERFHWLISPRSTHYSAIAGAQRGLRRYG